ncbi:unnamed protein product [Heligmosomoides polygyrus]|uniref:Sushi domain-containing protein n=1 Tax=Heligmosomoides polygyrus TaxID=6339 RepID=A0A183F3L4_HELPZ|nr:unnamed protein product [Heligmosomoides polygyrus]
MCILDHLLSKRRFFDIKVFPPTPSEAYWIPHETVVAASCRINYYDPNPYRYDYNFTCDNGSWKPGTVCNSDIIKVEPLK